MNNKIVSQGTKSILLECGPTFLGQSNIIKKAFLLIEQTKQYFGLDLEILVYTRSDELAHTNLDVGGGYLDIANTKKLYNILNSNGFKFNLALNGFPKQYEHVPLDMKEMNLLEDLGRSGGDTGLRNSVTITDNALLPAIRKIPDLDVIASCIAPSFVPNITDYRKKISPFRNNGEFLLSFYKFLYNKYDKVVPIVQLANPIFFSKLDILPTVLAEKTIAFLNLYCASNRLGKCASHYAGFDNEIEQGMPRIPKYFMSQKEMSINEQKYTKCTEATSSIKLINRPKDLLSLIKMGINQYKIPARDVRSHNDFRLLCRLISPADFSISFPHKNHIWGYSPASMKIHFLKHYPEQLWALIDNYNWPYCDESGGYSGLIASIISDDIHQKAKQMWENISTRS